MNSRRRDKTPVLHRLENQPRLTSPNSPNIYQREFERDKQQMPSQERSSQERRHASKYKKNKDKKSHNDQDQRLNFLIKQNSDLRKEIVELKVHQFYQFDDKKLKQLLTQVQQLRKQAKKLKQNLQQCQLQNEFLRRTNKQLQSDLQKNSHQLYSIKKSGQINNKTIPLSPKPHRSDEQLTDALTNHNSHTILEDVLQTYKTLGMMDSKSTQKKQRFADRYHYQKKQRKQGNQQKLLIQSRAQYAAQRMSSPRVKQRLSTSPREANQYFVYKAKKKNYEKG